MVFGEGAWPRGPILGPPLAVYHSVYSACTTFPRDGIVLNNEQRQYFVSISPTDSVKLFSAFVTFIMDKIKLVYLLAFERSVSWILTFIPVIRGPCALSILLGQYSFYQVSIPAKEKPVYLCTVLLKYKR